jgi:Gpi18-like mannosyltransferase
MKIERRTYNIAYLILSGIIILFSLFFLYKNGYKLFDIFVALIALALFLLILHEAIRKLIIYWSSPPVTNPLLLKQKPRSSIKAWAKIAGFVLVFHLLNLIVAYAVARLTGRLNTGFFDSLYSIWSKCGIDSPSYLGIAENWYVTEGDPMYHIVFFPFYPIVIKLFSFVFKDYFVSALIVSIASSIGMAITGYELVRREYSNKTAKYFVIATFLLMGSFFYTAAMTESLFMFLCLLCLYFTKKRNFAAAGIFGALAAFTRSPGLLLMVPVGIEYVKMLIEKVKYKAGYSYAKLIVSALFVLFISSGLLVYLYINYKVWGNPLQFSIFQREHWGQKMGYFVRTIAMISGNFCGKVAELNSSSAIWDYKTAFALWLPELIAIFGGLGAIAYVRRKINAKYLCYFLVYFMFTIGATWLLSAPRYLMASAVLPLGLALILSTKKHKTVVIGVMAVLNIAYLILFAWSSPIY